MKSFFVILIFIIISCRNDLRPVTFIDLTRVNLAEKATALASAYFKEVKTLIISDSVKMGEPFKVKIHDHQLYVVDEFKKALLILNLDGSLAHVINRSGEGPGYYHEIGDFELDDQARIYILDINMSSLFKYSKNGDCLAQQKINDYPYRILWHKDYLYVYTGLNSRGRNEKCMFTRYDQDLVRQSQRTVGCHEAKDYGQFRNEQYGPLSLYIYEQKLHIWEFCYNDETYQLDDASSKFIPCTKFDYNDAPALLKRKEPLFFDQRPASNFIYELTEYSNYLLFHGMDEEYHQFKLLYNKNTGDIHNNKFHFDIIDHGLIDDFHGRWPVWPLLRLNDSIACDYYYGYRLKEKKNNPDYLGRAGTIVTKEQDRIIYDHENPILRILYFKA